MQFGHAERPTHYSTSHDLARYEVPGHRFADLSEHGFGVALLTDCKYGYSTYGNQMRISLLRSPQMPDPDADVGRHEFAYAVMPHAGGWREAGVVAEAARFETPLRWAPAAPSRARSSRSTTPTWCWTRSSARRTRTRWCCGCTRPRRPRHRPPAGRPARSPRRGAATCWRTRAPSCRVGRDEIELAYRPHEIISVLRERCGHDPAVPAAATSGAASRTSLVRLAQSRQSPRLLLGVEEVQPVEVDRQRHRLALLDAGLALQPGGDLDPRLAGVEVDDQLRAQRLDAVDGQLRAAPSAGGRKSSGRMPTTTSRPS